MKTIRLLVWAALFFVPSSASAQLSDDFSDGNFTGSPAWTGNVDSWIINSLRQLQTSHTTANSTFYLSTAQSLAASVQWELSLELHFNTSSANYTDIFITASAADVTSPAATGYFVRIGNTDDEVSLYRKDADGTATKIIDGINGSTNKTENKLKIKVIRDAGYRFSLFRDAENNGIYTAEGSATDTTYTTSAYFGILVRQSTSSFFQKHFFDNISVKEYQPDTTPPAVIAATPATATTLDVLFSEPVNRGTAKMITNYQVNHSVGHPETATPDNDNAALVHLSFQKNFQNGVEHVLSINDLVDEAGNGMKNATAAFTFYIPQRFDIVIDEIMADPAPPVSLPNAEYIELKNVSGRPLNLKGWKLHTSTSGSGSFPDYTLPADSFVIITSTAQVQHFASYGSVLGIGSFPSLNNDSSTLILLSKENTIIHAVTYNGKWYDNEVKTEGGWSLEMIDTHHPCLGQNNWKASVHHLGGTPGRKNSVDAVNKDEMAPVLKSAYATDSTTLIIIFSEPVDSSSGANLLHYQLTPQIPIIHASTLDAVCTQVQIKLSAPIQANTLYTLEATGITDCSGNAIGNSNKVQTGLPQTASVKDVVINEILFNPKPNSYDFVECYNRSGKILDASQLYIANRSNTGKISSLKKFSEKPFYIFPDEYFVITEDAAELAKSYWVKNPDAVFTVTSLPSFPDDEGTVVLLDYQGNVLDELHYLSDWHFGLITEEEGISLERIEPDEETQNKTNWHSAGSGAGYATPTYQNSQFKQTGLMNASVHIASPVFSPDNDGYEDVATIQYQLAVSGYAANTTIFDAHGRWVRHLVKNEVLGLKGVWRWDGLDEKGQKLPVGTYIVYTELFNLQGKKESFKNTVVLARRMQ